ncbi:hypothetical protein E8E13_005526 [Curvularia kusanoi]|uniref:Uncharacterized protein n=1 Tax=Curvularia kusanoi TaxID=90978 RepID=A0A9P4TBA2_CURKU|nr:hypothetical protein E8E13_005526 [Curvularia kusanoi]
MTSGPQPQAMTGSQASQTSDSLDGPTRLTDLPPEILRVHFDFALFSVNKAIATEARAVFFTGNIFEFDLEVVLYRPLPIEFLYIFGPLGEPHLIHILRDLRHVKLFLQTDGHSHHGFKRLQTGLQLFVNAFNKSHDDPTKSSLLETLELHVVDSNPIQPWMAKASSLNKHIFALEVLADLKKPLTQLKTISLLPAWFSSCLALQLTGRGGRSTATLAWSTKVVKSSQNMYGKRKRAKVVETRAYWQPRLDWREFAARNGIEMPEDAGRYFPLSE